MRLVYSVRTAADVIYADELGAETVLTYTRQPPEGWDGHTGRIDAALIAAAAAPSARPRSSAAPTASWRPRGAPATRERPSAVHVKRTERFGPTGESH